MAYIVKSCRWFEVAMAYIIKSCQVVGGGDGLHYKELPGGWRWRWLTL